MYKVFITSLLTLLLLAGCDNAPVKTPVGKPAVLRIAPLPDEKYEVLVSKYQPMAEYLADKTGIKVELVIPTNYEDLLEKFQRGDIDIANFGAVTYLKAHRELSAKPLVMRNIDQLFTSVFLTRKDSNVSSIEQIKGKSFAFGSRLSTSGHLMPRFYLQDKNIVPENDFARVVYSGAHDKTAYLVRDGKVFAGASNATIVKNMFMDGRLSVNDVQILWETPTYPDYVWAIRRGISADVKDMLTIAFLSLDINTAEDKQLLDSLNAEYYVSANHQLFSSLEAILDDLTLKGIIR